MTSLEGRTALVTGASGAIGRACAVGLAGQAPEEPTQPAMPIVRGLLDGTLWDGVDLLPPLRPAVPEAAR